MSVFQIWGDEIAYEHRVVGKLTIGPTTLRDWVEEALLEADPEAAEKKLSDELEELRTEHDAELEEKDDEIESLRAENTRLWADLEAIDGGVTIAELRAELAVSQQATRDWIKRCQELQAPKPRKTRRRLTSTSLSD